MSLLHTAVGIFTIANPIGNLPIYLSFTDGNKRKDRAIASSAAFTFLIALLLADWLGNDLLNFFGISRAAFQVAGGLIVVLIGLSMLRSEPSKVHHDPDSVDRDQNSSVKGIVPLGIPLLAGPGTLTLVIADPLAASLMGKVEISLVILILSLVVYAIFDAGDMLSSKISTSALQVLTKIMGLLLTAIAIQMLFSGLSAGFPVLMQGQTAAG
ncbi:MarC family protein [Synechococcus sp. LA31]|jgi:multiple antibiotic resistance protein|uniref:MarC family protein n=1 Tax=Synechococcus sp. LA31 TaxID=2741953 RepID=UPI001BDC2EBA|nr:MarC family protein [Synechococcus sp. LA31]QVV66441.1 MarC family protein [Synechococcus sp. LA31]